MITKSTLNHTNYPNYKSLRIKTEYINLVAHWHASIKYFLTIFRIIFLKLIVCITQKKKKKMEFQRSIAKILSFVRVMTDVENYHSQE
ncbi:hypothetical protein ACI65C_010293 [Semiaphis heraclei]